VIINKNDKAIKDWVFDMSLQFFFQFIAGASGTVSCKKETCVCLCTSPVTPATAAPVTSTNYLPNYYNPYNNHFNSYFNSIFSNFPAMFSAFNYWPFTPYARPAAYPVYLFLFNSLGLSESV